MHRITTPKNPIVVDTAVSGVSTPSSIGQVFSGSEVDDIDASTERFVDDCPVAGWDQDQKFVVTWKNAQGQDRWCGRVSGGLSPESVVRLLALLTRNGIWLVHVERVTP